MGKASIKVSQLKVGLLQYFVRLNAVYVQILNQSGHIREAELAGWDYIFPWLDKFYSVLHGKYSPRQVNAAFFSFSNEWGPALLPPIDWINDLDILVIIPDHSLHGLPFHAIWLEGQDSFLGGRFGISYCSSATLFLRAVERNTVRTGNISDWHFSITGEPPVSAPPTPRRCLAGGVDVTDWLNPKYYELAKLFAGHFPDSSLLPPQNQRGTLKSSQDYLDTICLVTHGYYDRSDPNDSGLILGGMTGGYNNRAIQIDGREVMFRDLPLREVPQDFQTAPSITERGRDHSQIDPELFTIGELKIAYTSQVQLAAILACSSNTHQMLNGDFFESFADHWLKVGSASVLGTLWPLDFRFISKWLPFFLDNWLIQRQPKAIAWREALRRLLEERPEWPSSEWATIVLLGDWL